MCRRRTPRPRSTVPIAPQRSFSRTSGSFRRDGPWTLGGRLDDSHNHQLLLTPRIALIYQPSPASAVKMLYGSSFRNPSSFEQFYQDGLTQIGNPGLQPERMQTFELVFERRFSKRLE